MPRAGDYSDDVLISLINRHRLPILAELALAHGQTVAETLLDIERYPVRLLDPERRPLSRRVAPRSLRSFRHVHYRDVGACELAVACDWPTAEAWQKQPGATAARRSAAE